MANILVAIESFSTRERFVAVGETFRKGHPITLANPAAFREWKVDNDWPVEQATKGPGEKRVRSKKDD